MPAIVNASLCHRPRACIICMYFGFNLLVQAVAESQWQVKSHLFVQPNIIYDTLSVFTCTQVTKLKSAFLSKLIYYLSCK